MIELKLIFEGFKSLFTYKAEGGPISNILWYFVRIFKYKGGKYKATHSPFIKRKFG